MSRQGICDATLLGGLLDQRFGADALLDHVDTLMAPLDDADLDSFLYVAVADACDFDGVDMAVIADLAGVDRAEAPAIRQRLIGAGVCARGADRRCAPVTRPSPRPRCGWSTPAGPGDRNLDDMWRKLVQSMAKVGRQLGPLVSDGPIMTVRPGAGRPLRALRHPPRPGRPHRPGGGRRGRGRPWATGSRCSPCSRPAPTG